MSVSSEAVLRLMRDIALDPILMGANDLKECDRRPGESLNGLTSRLFHVLRPVPALVASTEETPLISLRPASLGVVLTLEVIL